MADMTGGIVLRKAANQIVNNSDALENDDDFSFAVAANEVWIVEIHAYVTIFATSDFKCTFTLPAGASMLLMGQVSGSAAVVDAKQGTTPGTAVAFLVAANAQQLHIWAALVMAGTAGTAQFQWAQNEAIAENTLLFENSMLLAAKEA